MKEMKDHILKLIQPDESGNYDIDGIRQAKQILDQATANLVRTTISDGLDKHFTPPKDDSDFDPIVNIDEIKESVRILEDIHNRSAHTPFFETPIPHDELNQYNREWLIHKWLPLRTITRFTGIGGLGKSYLSLQYAAALAAGIDTTFALNFDGCPPKETYQLAEHDAVDVVYASWEDEPSEVYQRISKISLNCPWAANLPHSYERITEKLHMMNMKASGPVWGPEHAKHFSTRGALLNAGHALLHGCEEKQAKLVIMDPLAAAFGGNENDRAAVREFCATLSYWCEVNDAAVLIISHPSKSDARGSGSTDWQAAFRSVWVLNIAGEEEQPTSGKTQARPSTKHYRLEQDKNSYDLMQKPIPLAKSIKSGQHGWRNLEGLWATAPNENNAIQSYNAYHSNTQRSTQEATNEKSELV